MIFFFLFSYTELNTIFSHLSRKQENETKQIMIQSPSQLFFVMSRNNAPDFGGSVVVANNDIPKTAVKETNNDITFLFSCMELNGAFSHQAENRCSTNG